MNDLDTIYLPIISNKLKGARLLLEKSQYYDIYGKVKTFYRLYVHHIGNGKYHKLLRCKGIEDLKAQLVNECLSDLIDMESKMAPGLAANLNDHGQSPASEESVHMVMNLTNKQKEVAHYIVTGMRSLEIADFMRISVKTVKYHITALYKKLGIRNRAGLIHWAYVNNVTFYFAPTHPTTSN